MTLLFHASKAYVDMSRKIGFILLLMLRETTGCDQGKGSATLSNKPLARQLSLEARKINGLLIRRQYWGASSSKLVRGVIV